MKFNISKIDCDCFFSDWLILDIEWKNKWKFSDRFYNLNSGKFFNLNKKSVTEIVINIKFTNCFSIYFLSVLTEL